MISLQSLFSDALWVFGLAGVLATASYMNWVRGVRQWTWARTLNTPMLLAPLCFSLFLFSGGMTLAAFFSAWPTPWWQMIAWSVLAVLFGVQGVLYARTGRRTGWDAPIEGQSNHE
ncbi:MAG: hypothetical protein IAE81_09690 [Caldilineaceae bacterium]|jgi:phosphoglycerol transferase MdoB-like AlkP superfamily enzyme|nr:hypothetical protein [Caldilineaceae bacterium]